MTTGECFGIMKLNRILIVFCLLVVHCTDGVEGRKRFSEGRSTEDIAIGCSLLGVFLIVVAVCTLYCRFCTKNKREERKLAKNAVTAASEPSARGGGSGGGSGGAGGGGAGGGTRGAGGGGAGGAGGGGVGGAVGAVGAVNKESGGSGGGSAGRLKDDSDQKKKDKQDTKESALGDDVSVDVPNIDITPPVKGCDKKSEDDDIESVKDEIVKPSTNNNMTSISEIE